MKFKQLFFIFLFFPVFSWANTFNAWVEMGPNNSAIARVITSDATCPNIKMDKVTQPMELRAAPNLAYPVRSCEMILSPHIKQVSVLGQTLALPKSDPQRIVIIGDTGCRLKWTAVQSCRDQREWPFAKIAAQAAKFKPDLVITTGDFHYRETRCPFWHEGCRNSPSGYRWAVWDADFFTPAAPLLKSAPWVMVRGNHEDCDRAYEGWYRFLDPFIYTTSCKKYSPLYTVILGNITLYVMDASNATDLVSLPEQTAQFQQYFKQITDSKKTNAWLVMHKPIWNALTPKQQGTLVSAVSNNLPDNLELVISGHIHQFQDLNFSNRPAQLIIGNSGTRLNKWYGSPTPKNLVINGELAIQPLIFDQFGYMTLEKQNNHWLGQVRNVEGKVLANCAQQGKQFICEL